MCWALQELDTCPKADKALARFQLWQQLHALAVNWEKLLADEHQLEQAALQTPTDQGKDNTRHAHSAKVVVEWPVEPWHTRLSQWLARMWS
jgi:hypothetical protein